MRAAVAGTPGQVAWLEMDAPVPDRGGIVLEPLACGICATDVKTVRRGHTGGPPRALGHELVGRVASAGEGSHWQVGQRVVAAPYLPCGECYFCLRGRPTLCEHLFAHSLEPGALAERVHVPGPLAGGGTFPVPDSLPSEVAALAEPLGCCLHAADDCPVASGDRVLVIGDGPMGLLNALVARARGASLVVVAGLSPSRLGAATACAHVVVNVAEEDLAPRVKALTAGRGADVVLVAVSSPQAVESGLRAVRPGGVLNVFAGLPEEATVPVDVRWLHYAQVRLIGSFGLSPAHLEQALSALARGEIDVQPLITGRFPFSETPAAVAYAAQQVGLKAVVLFEGGA